MPEPTAIDETVADRVARGAALLDTIRPGWGALVDLDGLDMMHGRMCIVGQVFGTYVEVIDTVVFPDSLSFEAADARAVQHGLQAHSNEGELNERVLADYARLTAAWTALIEARRA